MASAARLRMSSCGKARARSAMSRGRSVAGAVPSSCAELASCAAPSSPPNSSRSGRCSRNVAVKTSCRPTIEATTSAAICPPIPRRFRKLKSLMAGTSYEKPYASIKYEYTINAVSKSGLAVRRNHLDMRREHVTAGPHRLDQAGFLRIGLDLAADAADQHVDGALERSGVAPLGQVEQAVARQNAARPFAEGAQQVELRARHRHPRAVGVAQFAQAEIDPPAMER